MTEKQEKILNTALELFANQGYDATSTNKIAKVAGVSEGLVFRHFGSKQGLLEAIAELARKGAKKTHAALLAEKDPRKVIRNALELPRQIKEEEEDFWRLIYALKWQRKHYDHELSAPLHKALHKAFEDLNYADPTAEADLVLMTIDGLATAILLRKPDNIAAIYESLLKKYELT